MYYAMSVLVSILREFCGEGHLVFHGQIIIICPIINCFNVDVSTFYLHCLTLATCFSAREIPWGNVIAFSCDNCSVMKGRHNSVLTRIRAVQPHVLDIECICHLANLCCQQGVKQLRSQCETQGAVSRVFGLLRRGTTEDTETREHPMAKS